MINCTHEDLERLLGGPVPSIPEEDELGRATARALLDSLGPDAPAKAPEAKLTNARFWLDQLAKGGLEAGIRSGKQEERNRIRQLLGV